MSGRFIGDLALALLREVVTLRGDLRVLVMSATINAEKIAAILDSPVVSFPDGPGRWKSCTKHPLSRGESVMQSRTRFLKNCGRPIRPGFSVFCRA